MKKLITSMTLILGLSMTMLTNVAADTITFVHGNNGTSKYCYAETKQQKANHTYDFFYYIIFYILLSTITFFIYVLF